MEATEFDTDSMLKLLSDALRRGPGSPEWREAVTQFADANGPGADEYRLLLRARERLESGREYRQVRAGPAFTRAVFENLDSTRPASSGVPRPAILIGLLCLILLLAAGGTLLMHLIQSRPINSDQVDLQAQLFSTPKHQWAFSQLFPGDLKTAGTLKLGSRDNALRITQQPTTLPADGAVMSDAPVDLAAGACVEAHLWYQPGDTSLALVVSDTPGKINTKTNRQLAVAFDSAGVRCFSTAASTASTSITGGPHTVRIKFLKSVASAEIDGRVIWTGNRPLGPIGYPGLSWTKSEKPQNDAAVRSLDVLVP